MRLRLATRGSRLAWTQSGLVAAALTELGHQVELVRITTQGDVTTAPLASLGGAGVFVGAVREAVLSGAADFAVHSFKDLPTAPAPGLVLAAVPPREDPADALCARNDLKLAELPSGARVGTGSPRRAAQLKAVRPDLVTVAIRGNVETRLARRDEDLDAVVLAAAGLNRLGLGKSITERLDPAWFLPAPAQGALALECAADAADLIELLAELDDPATRLAAIAERAVLARLGAGCAAPVGAFAWTQGEELQLHARVVSVDGNTQIEGQEVGQTNPADALRLGTLVAEALLADGAAEVTDLAAAKPLPLAGRVVLLPQRSPSGTAVALAAAGAEVVTAEFTAIEALVDVDHTAPLTARWDWILITSPNTVELLSSHPNLSAALATSRVGAVGPATARALRDAGHQVDLVAEPAGGAGLAAALPEGPGRILIPGALEPSPEPAASLQAKGWQVERAPLYQTVPAPLPEAVQQRWRAQGFDALVVTAGSVAQAAAKLGLPGPKAIALGATAAQVAEAVGLEVAAIASRPDAAAITEAVQAALPDQPR